MARIFQTGWEVGSTLVFDVTAGGGAIETTTVAGPWSTYSWFNNATGSGTFTLDSAVTEFYFGARMYFQTAPGGTDRRLVHFQSSTGTAQMSLHLDTSGRLAVYRGTTAAVIATGTNAVAGSRWHYVEWYGKIDGSAGITTVKLNGTQEVTASSLNSKGDAGSTTTDRVNLSTGGASYSFYVDDLYVNDTTTSVNNSFSGDIRVSAYIPNAAGDNTTMSLSTGSDHAALVDERPPNTTDYIYGTGTTEYDLLNIPNTSGIAQVQAATLWLYSAKSDAGTANIAHVVKYDSDNDSVADTESAGADTALSTTFAYYRKNYNTDPGGNAWTAAKIDALQIGAKSR
jgi:hypothetical protein